MKRTTMGGERRHYRFSDFRVDTTARELLGRQSVPIPLASRALDVLIYLIEHRDRVVDKDELLSAVWAGRVVEENNLTQAIASLRRVFGVGAGERRYILTLPNRGYRFVAELSTEPAVATERVRAVPAAEVDPAAERLYLAGRDLIDAPNVGRAKRAVGVFRKVLDIDPTHSRAWSGLAFAWRALTINGDMDPQQAFPLSAAAVDHALALDPDSSHAHAARGFNLYWHDWDWRGTELACLHAIELDPRVPDGHFVYAHLLHNVGRFEEALVQTRIARELNPLAPLINIMEAYFFAAAGRMVEAEARVAQALDIAPDYWTAYLASAGMAMARGNPAEAIAALEQAGRLSGRSSLVLAALAPALVATGERTRAEQLREELKTLAEATYVPGTSRAAISNALGDAEEALDLLELACDQRDVRMVFLKTDARWNNLRSRPRFQALMDRMGFTAGAASGVL